MTDAADDKPTLAEEAPMSQEEREGFNLWKACDLAREAADLTAARQLLARALRHDAAYENRKVADMLAEHPLTALIDERVAELEAEILGLI